MASLVLPRAANAGPLGDRQPHLGWLSRCVSTAVVPWPGNLDDLTRRSPTTVLRSAGACMEFRVLGPLEVTRAGRALTRCRPGAIGTRDPPAERERRRRRGLAGGPVVAGRAAGKRGARGARGRLAAAKVAGRRRWAPDRDPQARLRAAGRAWGAGSARVPGGCAGRAGLLAAQGDPESASELFGEASALWRGPALADLADEPFTGAAAARLDESRLEAVEERIAADLELGRHARLVAELEEWVAVHPLRERLRAQLMRALYGCGRQADALAVFRKTRALLVNDLGIEPGPELREVEASILAWDSRPDSRPDRTRAGVGGQAQLPLDTAAFTGRTQEMDRILALVATARDGELDADARADRDLRDRRHGRRRQDRAGRAAPPTSWPTGSPTGSCSSTCTATPTGRCRSSRVRRSTACCARSGCRATGSRPTPTTGPRCTAAAGRPARADRAGQRRDARPRSRRCCPATPGCLVLVTSRRRLAALDDATCCRWTSCRPPTPSRCSARSPARPGWPATTAPSSEMVELCGRLPLAIRIAAARLRHLRLGPGASGRPAAPASTPAGRTGRAAQRHRGLRVSYQDLDEEHQRRTSCWACTPAPDLDPYAAAALLDTGVDVTGGCWRSCSTPTCSAARPGPLPVPRPDARLRRAAGRRADTDPDREAALTRLLDYYLYATGAAVGRILPSQRRHTPSLPPWAVGPSARSSRRRCTRVARRRADHRMQWWSGWRVAGGGRSVRPTRPDPDDVPDEWLAGRRNVDGQRPSPRDRPRPGRPRFSRPPHGTAWDGAIVLGRLLARPSSTASVRSLLPGDR